MTLKNKRKNREIELFSTSHIRSSLAGIICFDLAKHGSLKQIANTCSRSYERRSISFLRVEEPVAAKAAEVVEQVPRV